MTDADKQITEQGAVVEASEAPSEAQAEALDQAAQQQSGGSKSEKSVKRKWVRAARLEDLPEGGRLVVRASDEDPLEPIKKTLLLINHKGIIYAVANACPHLGYPLKGGRIENNEIHCPFHRSAFNLETGDVATWSPWPPGIGVMLGKLSKERALERFDIGLGDGSIWVALDQLPKDEPDAPPAEGETTAEEGEAAQTEAQTESQS